MALVIVFIGTICDYYFGAIGAVLGASVVIASLPKNKADAVFPSLLIIGSSWGAGELLAGDLGAMAGVVSSTALALWLEAGSRPFSSDSRHSRISSRDNAGS